MAQLHSVPNNAQVLDTMIGLTRLSLLQRAIIAGHGSMELYLGLRRRGFMRVAPVSMSRMRKRQHAIGLVADRDPVAIETALEALSPFLGANATVAILLESADGTGSPDRGSSSLGSPGLGSPGLGSPGLGSPGLGSPGLGSPGLGSPGVGVRSKLQEMGFQIEAGVRCHQGFVLLACRQGFGRIEHAA